MSQIPNWILSSESSSGTGDCRNAAPTVVGCSVLNWFLTNRLTRQLFPTLESPSCGQASGGAGEPAGRARARGQLRANTSLHSVVLGAAIPPCAQAGEEFRSSARRREKEKKEKELCAVFVGCALRAGRGAHCPSVFVCVAHLSLEMTALFIYLWHYKESVALRNPTKRFPRKSKKPRRAAGAAPRKGQTRV